MIPALTLLGTVAADAAGSLSSIAPAITGAGTPAVSSGAPADFGSVLAQVTGDAVDKLKAGEATSISGLQGKASVQEVAKSVLDAQQSLQTAVAVRDKVVSAYQEVSRMAI
ncbi:MAG: flagellar hook-basal body complex protein FliE [Pseudomonadota bacterium]